MLGKMHTFRLKGMIQMPRSIIVATILWIFGLYLLINNVMLVARAYNPPTQRYTYYANVDLTKIINPLDRQLGNMSKGLLNIQST